MVDKIQITKTRRVKTPARGTAVAAGLDFFVPEDLTETDMEKMFSKTGHPLDYVTGPDGFVSEFVIKPGQSACIPSGIKARLPHGYCMEFHNKSGVACKKSLLAGSCLIDEDYQGEWHIDVHNVSSVNAAHTLKRVFFPPPFSFLVLKRTGKKLAERTEKTYNMRVKK